MPQLFYASISRLRCDGRARGAIYVARIELFKSGLSYRVRLSFGDKRESSCSCNTLKLTRMMVPIAGNASDFSELLPERFDSKESAVSILYTTINSCLVLMQLLYATA